MKLDLKIGCDARYFIEKLYKYMKILRKILLGLIIVKKLEQNIQLLSVQ